jgi:hypothetical protein
MDRLHSIFWHAPMAFAKHGSSIPVFRVISLAICANSLSNLEKLPTFESPQTLWVPLCHCTSWPKLCVCQAIHQPDAAQVQTSQPAYQPCTRSYFLQLKSCFLFSFFNVNGFQIIRYLPFQSIVAQSVLMMSKSDDWWGLDEQSRIEWNPQKYFTFDEVRFQFLEVLFPWKQELGRSCLKKQVFPKVLFLQSNAPVVRLYITNTVIFGIFLMFDSPVL